MYSKMHLHYREYNISPGETDIMRRIAILSCMQDLTSNTTVGSWCVCRNLKSVFSFPEKLLIDFILKELLSSFSSFFQLYVKLIRIANHKGQKKGKGSLLFYSHFIRDAFRDATVHLNRVKCLFYLCSFIYFFNPAGFKCGANLKPKTICITSRVNYIFNVTE